MLVKVSSVGLSSNDNEKKVETMYKKKRRLGEFYDGRNRKPESKAHIYIS